MLHKIIYKNVQHFVDEIINTTNSILEKGPEINIGVFLKDPTIMKKLNTELNAYLEQRNKEVSIKLYNTDSLYATTNEETVCVEPILLLHLFYNQLEEKYVETIYSLNSTNLTIINPDIIFADACINEGFIQGCINDFSLEKIFLCEINPKLYLEGLKEVTPHQETKNKEFLESEFNECFGCRFYNEKDNNCNCDEECPEYMACGEFPDDFPDDFIYLVDCDECPNVDCPERGDDPKIGLEGCNPDLEKDFDDPDNSIALQHITYSYYDSYGQYRTLSISSNDIEFLDYVLNFVKDKAYANM